MTTQCAFAVLGITLALGIAHPGKSAVADPVPGAAPTGAILGRVRNAATGGFLPNVRVTLKGTDQVAFTDDAGFFRFVGLPAGAAELEVFYTDMDPQRVPLTVAAGGTVEQEIALSNLSRYGASPEVIKLDAYRVASNRETDAAALATNEQRFAPNIKNVIATDALGDVFGNHAGDFLKSLPGLAAEYDNADVSGISIRGLGADKTAVTIDGMPLSSGSVVGPTRSVQMGTLALNNLSRLEVTKVPSPSQPADALAGSINLIGRSAFERSTPELRNGVSLAGNGNALTLESTPHGFLDRDTYKIQPGIEFDYTLPAGKHFGLVVTGMESNKFVTQNLSTTTWNNAGTGTGASTSLPYFQQFISRAFPRHTVRSVYSMRADWRMAPNSVLSVGGRWSRWVNARSGGFRLAANAGTNGIPTPATGTSFAFGPDFTQGATGRGDVSMTGEWQYGKTYGHGADIRYRYEDGRWRVETAVSFSAAESVLNPSRGPVYFNTVTAVMRTPVRVTMTGISPNGPRTIQAFNNTNQEVDLYNIDNYVLSAATQVIRKQVTGARLGKVDVRRRLNVLPFPTAVQVGAQQQFQSTDTQRWEAPNWTAAPATSPAPFLYRVFKNQETPGGFRNFPGIDPGLVSRGVRDNPALFTQTPAQVAAAETTRLNASERAEETVDAAYLQGEVRLFGSRLNVLTGVRHERTTTEGDGLLFDPNAAFVRNADGTFARNAQGARIRRPEAGTAGSLQEVRLTRTERGYRAARTYDGLFPSLHLTASLRENFLARLAYARTYGRPNFPDIIPNATINEADLEPNRIGDPSVVQGTITVRNTGLKPWTADNFDLSLEYYTTSGGLLSAGAFLKEIANFFGNEVRVATPADLELLGLDPKYVGWNLATKFNSGAARVSGVELNARHSLRGFTPWGRYFTVFANATQLRLEGSADASFQSFIPRTANWGVSFNWRRLSIGPRWNYRGLNKLVAVPAFGLDAYRYIKARTILDLNLVYQLTPRLALSATVNNLFNDQLTTLVYGSQTPRYARQSLNGDYGAVFALGLKGTY